MIISRSPLRITLGGGGTDLESYFNKNGGFVISLAIKKYITIVVKKSLKKNFEIKYSEYENVKNVNYIKHNIVRECLKKLKIKSGIEISSFSDVPHGTGLGSSGAFCVCLLNALNKFKNIKISKRQLVFDAYNIERNILKQPVGFQDQAIAAYGGMLHQTYSKKKIIFKKARINSKLKKKFENNFFLIFTGDQRNSKKILLIQDKNSKKNDKKMIENLNYTKKLGYLTKASIKKNLQNYEKIMKEHWEYKKRRKGMLLNKNINKIINICLKNKADSFKLVGAGGSGYVLAYTKEPKILKKALKQKKIIFFKTKIDETGTKLIKLN